MRDSALKLRASRMGCRLVSGVGEELMRDSALKPAVAAVRVVVTKGRRRAHARQRFETFSPFLTRCSHSIVGEELMRDSALKLSRPSASMLSSAIRRRRAHARQRFETSGRPPGGAASLPSEKSSCATAL